MQRRSAVLITALLVLGLLALASGPALGQAARQPFEWIIAKQLTVLGSTSLEGTLTTSGDMVIGDDLNVTDGATIAGTLMGNDIYATGDVRAGDDLQAANFLRMVPTTAITVTAGMAIQPTGSYQPLRSAGAVGATLALTGSSAGNVVVLVNEVNQTITISDTSTTMLAGNVALGQYDTLTVITDGTNWYELDRSNN